MIAPRSFKVFWALAISAGLSASATAQKKVRMQDLSSQLAFEDLQSPNVQTGNSKRFKPKDWLEIEVKAKLNNVPTASKKLKMHDTVTVEWNVIVKGQDNKAYLIKKSVEHVNVPSDEDTFFSIYISPNTLKRITGKDGGGKSDLETVGGEIKVGGVSAGFFHYGKLNKGWWTKPVKGVELTQAYPLMDKSQTPFALFWYDRYAEIKPKDR